MSADIEVTAALLDAGAVLPAGAPVTKDDTVDTLTARTYRHPALDERSVVRLVPATLGEAEDLSLEFLAFTAPERVDDVGLIRQQALGFPAWALVHDPANGHHALALVKDIERLARTAKSRVGPANDGFNALAERLARSVPHFLPTFYEEAGRAFLAADSPSYAAMMFGRARDAERTYGLDIDEERQHAVFLEFALAGALTAKALSAHARDLAARCEPATAYRRFRRLCVERTLGGLPPYAGMHIDLRRLAKTSGLDLVAADGLVLGDLLGAPAILRAPAAFWSAYQPSLIRLASTDAAMRGRLLGLFPDNCADDVWLAVLDDAGATAALTDPAGTVPAEAASPDGPAGWLTRFAARRQARPWRETKRLPALLALVERMAPRLIADAVPVALCGENDDVDLDLLDTCLATGVAVADPHAGARLPVSRWLADDTGGRRGLVALAADERLRSQLRTAIENSLGDAHDPRRIAALLAVPGLRLAVSGWLADVADAVVGHGLPALGRHLDRLKLAASPEGFAVNPDAVRRAAGHDLGPVLGGTLRAGVLDEYGWPAWDDAVARLRSVKTKGADEKVSLTQQWPVLVARRGDLVLAVGPERVEREHLAHIPKGQRGWMWRLVLRYVDGELLVCWDKGPDRAGYWTNQPDDVFVVADDAFSTGTSLSLPLPGGGRTHGGRPLRVGDRAEQHVGTVAGDGTSYWVLTRHDKQHVWREYDPATGTQGRAWLPRFFEDGAGDGERLELDECWLLPAAYPAGSGPVADPLGHQEGLIGWRVRTTPDRGLAGVGVDGRAFRLAGSTRRRRGGLPGRLCAAIRFPHAQTTYGVLYNHGWNNESITLCSHDGIAIGSYQLGAPKQRFARGTPLLPPLLYWHHMRPRDPRGSAALRTLTDERATALLAGAAGLDGTGVRALVAREMPELTHPALIAGVAGVVRIAAKRAATLREFARVLDGQAVYPKASKTRPVEAASTGTHLAGTHLAGTRLAAATDEALAGALGPFITYCVRRGNSGIRMIAAAAAALTAAKPPTGKWPHANTDSDWYDVLGVLGVLPAAMYLSVAPFTPPDQREALLLLLETYVASGLSASGGRLRRVTLEADAKADRKPGSVLQVDRRRLLVTVAHGGKHVTALEYAPDGQFGPIPGFAITAEQEMELPDAVEPLVRKLREDGPPPWRPESAVALSQAAGVGHAEALLLLAGLPDNARATELGIGGHLLGAARAAWRTGDRSAGLMGLLLPDDRIELWTGGPRLDRVVAWRTQRYGQRSPVPDELIESVHRAGIAEPMSASELLHGIANVHTCRWLGASGPDTRIDADAEDVATALARALPWFAYHLPVDHPLRAHLPAAADAARRRLIGPDCSPVVGYLPTRKAVDRVIAAIGGTAIRGAEGFEVGPVVIEDDDHTCWVRLRPGMLTGIDDPALAVLLAHLDDPDDRLLAAIRLLLSGQLAESVAASPADRDGGYPHDPGRSAPGLVSDVAGALSLGSDAATLYLQLLALPDPTDRNVARWTGWKPARLAAARKELGGTDLVVAAKRTRAGRSLFLPGGWLALRGPHLPVERWKIPMLTLEQDGSSALDVVVPVAPLPRIFELAWQRVTGGDTPRFDELNTTERRR